MRARVRYSNKCTFSTDRGSRLKVVRRWVTLHAMARAGRDPHFLAAFFGSVLAGVVGVVAIVETDSWWVVAATIAAVILLLLAIALDVSAAVDDRSHDRPGRPSPEGPPPVSGAERPGIDYRGPEARHRLLVMTSEPLPAERVLEAVTGRTESSMAPAALGVMVVSPAGFGESDVTNDESQYEAAHRAEGETVASLRRASVKAAGHVGDHDAARAIADSLVLFPAERVLVFAHPAYSAAYRRAIDPAAVDLPVDIVEVVA
jgi:hypothetical protein